MHPTWSDDLLSAYLDRELDPSLRQYVAAQVQQDPAKQELLRQLRHNRQLMSELPVAELDVDLSDRVLQTAVGRLLSSNEMLSSEMSRHQAEFDNSNDPIYDHEITAFGKSAEESGRGRNQLRHREKWQTVDGQLSEVQDWRVAASALVGLAACLLLILWLPAGEGPRSIGLAASTDLSAGAELIGSAEAKSASISGNRDANSSAGSLAQTPHKNVEGQGNRDSSQRQPRFSEENGAGTGRSALTSDPSVAASQADSQAEKGSLAKDINDYTGRRDADSDSPATMGNDTRSVAGMSSDRLDPERRLGPAESDELANSLGNRNWFPMASLSGSASSVAQVILVRMGRLDFERHDFRQTLRDSDFDVIDAGDYDVQQMASVMHTDGTAEPENSAETVAFVVDASSEQLSKVLRDVGGQQMLLAMPAEADQRATTVHTSGDSQTESDQQVSDLPSDTQTADQGQVNRADEPRQLAYSEDPDNAVARADQAQSTEMETAESAGPLRIAGQVTPPVGVDAAANARLVGPPTAGVARELSVLQLDHSHPSGPRHLDDRGILAQQPANPFAPDPPVTARDQVSTTGRDGDQSSSEPRPTDRAVKLRTLIVIQVDESMPSISKSSERKDSADALFGGESEPEHKPKDDR